jgi:hypothetical protein
MKRRLPIILAFAIAMGLAFTWGFTSFYYQYFPYYQIRSIARSFDMTGYSIAEHVAIKSASPGVFEALVEIGYVEGTFDPQHDRRGVFEIDEHRVDPSLRFYTESQARAAVLIDPTGRELHRWSHPTQANWNFSYLLDDGGVLAIVKDVELLRLDSDSNPVWRLEIRAHHDLDVFEDAIFVLTRDEIVVPAVHPTRTTLVDRVSRYTMDGELVDEISVYDMLARSRYRYLLPAIEDVEIVKYIKRDLPLDILHTNHVEVFDGSLADRDPIFRRGNLLLCLRNLNLVMIYDPAARDLVWAWGPTNLVYPHHPSLTPAGTVLIFDNRTDASQIVEIDPLTFRMQWRFRGDGFFSRTRGSVQRLANGNTLITESNSGYVFEVTPQQEVVWRFANPEVDDAGHRSAVFRMTAHDREATPFLKSLSRPGPDARTAGLPNEG